MRSTRSVRRGAGAGAAPLYAPLRAQRRPGSITSRSRGPLAADRTARGLVGPEPARTGLLVGSGPRGRGQTARGALPGLRRPAWPARGCKSGGASKCDGDLENKCCSNYFPGGNCRRICRPMKPAPDVNRGRIGGHGGRRSRQPRLTGPDQTSGANTRRSGGSKPFLGPVRVASSRGGLEKRGARALTSEQPSRRRRGSCASESVRPGPDSDGAGRSRRLSLLPVCGAHRPCHDARMRGQVRVQAKSTG